MFGFEYRNSVKRSAGGIKTLSIAGESDPSRNRTRGIVFAQSHAVRAEQHAVFKSTPRWYWVMKPLSPLVLRRCFITRRPPVEESRDRCSWPICRTGLIKPVAAWMRAPDIYISLSDEALLLGVQQTTVNGISVWSQATRNLNSWRRLSLKGKAHASRSDSVLFTSGCIAFLRRSSPKSITQCSYFVPLQFDHFCWILEVQG